MTRLTFKTPLDTSANRKLRSEFTMRLSQRMKEVRKSKKMTQQQLADKAGLHLTYVGHLELGRYHPTVFVIWKLAKVLRVSIDELVDF